MKNLFVILFLIFVSTNLFSQDIITYKTGEDAEVKVVEVGEDIIKYKKLSNIDGPTFTVKKSQVFRIKYKNGEQDVFESTASEKEDSEAVVAPIHITKNQQLSFKLKTFGTKYYEGGMEIDKADFTNSLKQRPEVYDAYTKGANLNLIGNLVGIPAGAVFGWNVGTIAGGGEANGEALRVSGVLWVGSLVMIYVGAKKMTKSIEAFNSNGTVRLRFDSTESGTGLVLSF